MKQRVHEVLAAAEARLLVKLLINKRQQARPVSTIEGNQVGLAISMAPPHHKCYPTSTQNRR